jgi:uncharacterized protein YndB with AHSA1/START domain
MSTTTKHETEISADPNLPTITITREFDAPRERVFRAFTDPELVAQWLGPNSTTTRIDTWDCRTGGSYRYVSILGDEEYGFYGAFHEVRPNERIVQTFTFEGQPDGVSLETVSYEALEGDRTRVTMLSVVESMELRDGILSSGMDVGVNEGFQKLDNLLEGAA